MSDKKILNVKMPNIIDSYYEDEEFQAELEGISLEKICDSEQTRVIKNIRKTLASTLKKKYGFTNGELKELTTKILKIHGLDESNFDTLSMFDSFVSERIKLLLDLVSDFASSNISISAIHVPSSSLLKDVSFAMK